MIALHLSDIKDVALGGVLLPGILMAFRQLIAKGLIRTEEDAIKWIHYRQHSSRRGHTEKHPSHCEDDNCTKITG